jgi:hypothetical protein
MTDPKYPALLAAERWFATEQTKSDLATVERETAIAHNYHAALEAMRGLARIAFVAGYEAGRKARGDLVAAFCASEAKRFDESAALQGPTWGFGRAQRLRAQAALFRTLAAQVARGDDETSG